MHLSTPELRVLGALIEKEITTPDLYPLSLHSLQAACNQRSSRDPVLDLTEDELRQALHTLEDLGLTSVARGGLGSGNSRVAKFEHHARTVLQLRRDETALLCLLLLRGPQTPGELRSRADRLYTFDDLTTVVDTLDRLAARPGSGSDHRPEEAAGTGPLVTSLPRQPGAREMRYAHLLGGPVASAHLDPASPAAGVQSVRPVRSPDDFAALEARVLALEERLTALETASSGEPAS